MPMILDLEELKVNLEIDPANTAEDRKLLFFIEYATAWIEEYLDRPGLFSSLRTEYYKGTGTQKLQLRSRPVSASYFDIPSNSTKYIQVYVDESGYYGSPTGAFNATTSALTYGVDFGLQFDNSSSISPNANVSRSGILFRIGNLWPRPTVRSNGLLSPFIGEDFGSIKVVYLGGYTMDSLPPQLRLAIITMVARMRSLLPTGLVAAGESYEERAIQYADPYGTVKGAKSYIMSLAASLLFGYRNWKFVWPLFGTAAGMWMNS